MGQPFFYNINKAANSVRVLKGKAFPYIKYYKVFVHLGRVAGFKIALELYQLQRALGRNINSKALSIISLLPSFPPFLSFLPFLYALLANTMEFYQAFLLQKNRTKLQVILVIYINSFIYTQVYRARFLVYLFQKSSIRPPCLICRINRSVVKLEHSYRA